MRRSAGRKAQSRREIVDKAAERLRSDGMAAVGIRTLMRDAGLTHGAFYAHFEDREDLLGEALHRGLEETRTTLARSLAGVTGDAALESFVATYLRPVHRDHVAQGCAAAALAPEVARLSVRVRERFWAGVVEIAALIEPLLPPGGSAEERRDRATALFASLMGSLQLARAAPDRAASDAVLAAGRMAALAIAGASWLAE